MGALEKKTLCATEKEEKGRNSAFLGLCSEKLDQLKTAAMCPKMKTLGWDKAKQTFSSCGSLTA